MTSWPPWTRSRAQHWSADAGPYDNDAHVVQDRSTFTLARGPASDAAFPSRADRLAVMSNPWVGGLGGGRGGGWWATCRAKGNPGSWPPPRGPQPRNPKGQGAPRRGCRRVARLEDDNGGLGWPPGCVVVEVLVDLGPAGPQPLALFALCAARTDLSCSVAGLGDGVRMILQVQPPRGFCRTPSVHRHRDQVATVLEVADDDLSWHPTASARRGEPQRPPPARLRPPQTEPAAVARSSARWPCQKATMNQRGGSRARRLRATATRASRSLDMTTA